MTRSKLANPSAFREPAPFQDAGMSPAELAALNQAWRRRCERIPAQFGSYEAYLQAVAEGLFEREPSATYNTLPEAKLLAEIEAAVSVPMPPWKPRPEGGSQQCLMSLALYAERGADNDDDDE